MKIAHFVSGYPVLSETFVRDELAGFAEKGFRNVVVSLRPQEKDLSDSPLLSDPALGLEQVLYPRLSPAGIINPFPRPETLPGGFPYPDEVAKNLYLRFVQRNFVSRLTRLGVDHCHAHFAHYPATLAWMCANRLGVGFSFNAHSYDLFKYWSYLPEKVNDAKLVFPISKANRNWLLEFAEEREEASSRVQVIHCGIDPVAYPFHPPTDPPTDRPARIVAVGRLVDTKGFDVLLEALPNVLGTRPEVEVEIIGEGSERSRLEELTVRLGVAEQVRLSGALPREEVRSRQASADLIVQPCRAGRDGLDGIPVVVMEAMALGVPVISTRFASIPELIEDGVSGRLVEPGDSAGLAKAIIEVLDPGFDRERMAVWAREVIERDFNGPANYRAKADLLARVC